MLTRLAACFLSASLLSSAAAAHTFAEPPIDRTAMVGGVPVEAPSRAQLRAALAKRRAKNLASFRAYRTAGVYPHNTVRLGPLNVWIDADGHLCAAATMISKDGKHDLVLETGKTDNFIRLQNVTSGPLLDWILTSGLTIEEIDRIQMPMVWPDEGRNGIVDYAAEDAKLAASYAQTELALAKATKRSLDKAVDRLIKNPLLARQLVDASRQRG